MADSIIYRRLLSLDKRLGDLGFPRISDWWLETIRDFYNSGKRTLAVRVGRRGGKSSTLVRLAVIEALYGDHKIARGDVGVVAFISVKVEEAKERVRLIKEILDALRVKWKPLTDGVELVDKPVVFKVYTASIGGVSGFSCICALCDEVAKWKDNDKGSNPATEVLNSLRPTFAGQKNAKLFLSSSPMGRDDAHAKAIDKGDTDTTMVRIGETWVVRPGIDLQECMELVDNDPDIYMREFGCVPFDGSTSGLFTEEKLKAVTREDEELPPEPGVTYFAAQDPGTRANAWTLAIAKAVQISDASCRVDIVKTREWRGSKGNALNSDSVFADIREELAAYGITDLWSDQWSFDPLSVVAQKHKINLLRFNSSATTKVQMYEALKRRVGDRTVSFPDVLAMRKDLCGVRKWISRAGAFSMELEKNGSRHSDYAPSVALVTLKAAEEAAEPSFIEAAKAWRESGGMITNFD